MVREGFRPVGTDFPVFLHSRTNEYYVLVHSERQTVPGSQGSFSMPILRLPPMKVSPVAT